MCESPVFPRWTGKATGAGRWQARLHAADIEPFRQPRCPLQSRIGSFASPPSGGFALDRTYGARSLGLVHEPMRALRLVRSV